jgi:hypothetical protein
MNTALHSELNGQIPADYLEKIEKGLKEDRLETSFLYLFDLLMRIFSVRLESINPGVGLPGDAAIIETLYRAGKLSAEAFRDINQFLETNNQIVHNLRTNISRESIERLISYITWAEKAKDPTPIPRP